MKKIPYEKVIHNTDADELVKGKNDMIQYLQDLAPIVIPIVAPKTKAKKSLTSNFTILRDLINSMNKGVGMIEARKDEEGKYCICGVDFSSMESDVLYHFPLDLAWILKRTNKPLYNLFIETVRIMSIKGHNIDPDDIGEIHEFIYHILEDLINNNVCGKDEYNEHQEGIDELFFCYESIEEIYSIISNKKPKSIDYLRQKCKTIKVNLDLESELVTWIDLMLDSLKFEPTLNNLENNAIEVYQNYHGDDLDEYGNPVHLGEIFQISYFGNIHFIKQKLEFLGNQGGNFGQLVPGKTKLCYSVNDLKEFQNTSLTEMNDQIKNICSLSESLIEIRDEFFNRYKKTKGYARTVTKAKKRNQRLSGVS